MTTASAVVALQVPVSCGTLLVPAVIANGVTEGAKNPAGYFKVIVPPMGIAVVTMNPTVTDTNVRQAIRSDGCISNDTAETCPTIEPEDTASEAVGSVDV
jgi:hypothetical protein